MRSDPEPRARQRYSEIEAIVAASGLMLRGGFHPRPADGVPSLADGRVPGTVLMLGNAGPAMWRAFAAAPELADGGRDPLDRWTRRSVCALAGPLGATPMFPFGGPPHLPFQRWAMRADCVAPSPIGLLIHPEHGLWHAYRAALGFAEALALPPRREEPSPCERCAERPCLRTCPVAAFSSAGYDVAACVRHIGSPPGADCMALGCRARRACPVGVGYAQAADQAAFHMLAFRDAANRSAG